MDRRQFITQTVSTCLAGHLAASSAWSWNGAPQRVAGSVMAEGQPLKNVLVSDGRQVVMTDADGHYELSVSAESGHFLFVCTPRGYWTERFFSPISEATSTGIADFKLQRVSQPDAFNFVFITDMHLESQQVGVPKFKASLAEISKLRPRPAFLWAQGDICLQGGAGDVYSDCLSACDMPVRNGAGNHEMMLKDANPRGQFESRFGPSYYSFDWGPIHCVVLDGNKPIPNEEGWKAVHGAVEGRELQWLKADLAAQPTGKPIVVGVHIPIVSTYPKRREDSPENAPYWEMTNRQELTSLFARHDVQLVLQGHMHENERITTQGVEYVETISISGGWWKQGKALERGVDGCPRGYRIISVDGNQMTHRYQSSCESRTDRQGEFYDLAKPVKADPQTSFVFNCYDAPNGSTAQARIDDGPWVPMPCHRAMNKSLRLIMPHHFRSVIDTSQLPTGRHWIEAEVTFPDESTVCEKAGFELVP